MELGAFFANCDGEYDVREAEFIDNYIAEVSKQGISKDELVKIKKSLCISTDLNYLVSETKRMVDVVEDDEKTTEYGKTVLQTTPTIAKDIDEAKTNISLVDGLKEEKTEPVKTKEVTSEDNEEKKPSYTPDKKKLDEIMARSKE